MKAICTKDSTHEEFITTVHVMQEWIVDKNGEYVDTKEECLTITVEPNSENIWRCHICGHEAEVSE